MIQIFINLKRFDVPRKKGGVCPMDNPADWIAGVINRSVELGLGADSDLAVTYLLPEALILRAQTALNAASPDRRKALAIGSQGVYREDVSPGANFGAFTTNLPAAAAVNLGCTWAIIGHSEERKDKLGVIEAFRAGAAAETAGQEAVDRLVGQEVSCALAAGLNVLLCVGETANQRPQIREVLDRQMALGLEKAGKAATDGRVVIGYEPIWAIGPGKTPPDAKEIGEIAATVKEIATKRFGGSIPVVYGGGLKEENAAGIAGQTAVDGGLVALTRFTGEIGFDPDGLAAIIAKYKEGAAL